jgi:hypothetical protein
MAGASYVRINVLITRGEEKKKMRTRMLERQVDLNNVKFANAARLYGR